MRRSVVMLLLGSGLALALAGGLALWVTGPRRLQEELRLAEREYLARDYGKARARLARLQARWPGQGSVEYRLGVFAEAEGDTEAALAAWGRVPDEAPESARARLARGRLALSTGRYALAEACLTRAGRVSGEVGEQAKQALGRLDWLTGRVDQYRQLLRKQAERSPDPSGALRMLWSIDTAPYPVEAMSDELEKASKGSPEDDRVWLALADLNTRMGHYDEADAWLTRCERARPDDKDVWRARLNWAMAAERPGEAARALEHLSTQSLARSELLKLKAWDAARRGDRPSEQSALEDLLALDPGESNALERLADLAAQEGNTKRVADLRQRKAALDAARDRYRVLMTQADLAQHALELAKAAESLGRLSDARAWWALALRRHPAVSDGARAAIARLTRAEQHVNEQAPTAAYAELVRSLGQEPQQRTVAKTNGRPNSQPNVADYRDEAQERGLHFTFDNGRTDMRQLPETMSGGVGVLDFDGDGWLDIYSVQGGPFPPPQDTRPFGDRLFRNVGNGRFEDATESAGLAAFQGGYGHGVAVGDYDNDGRPDLLVTRWRSYALYHNLGHGRFEDATESAGLGGDRDWPTSAAWADLDGDGDLDLYVCHYLKWDPATSPPCQHPTRPEHTYCEPRDFPALGDHVFRNDGGRFVDVTEQAGIVDRDGRGLGVVAADLDADGKVDLFVANDTTANYFFRNLGGFRFVEQGLESGLATNAQGGYLAGMGVAYGDLDADGKLDLAVTNFFGESTTLYHNFGGGQFSDRTAAAGLLEPTRFVLGFGLAALDANNDSWVDLAQANGHVNDYQPATPNAMPAQLFLGGPRGRFVDVSGRAGAAWLTPRLGRGLAVGDLDNDGQLEVLIVGQNAPLALLHNRAAGSGHYLTISLQGTQSNRDGIGAVVRLTCAGRSQVQARSGGGSYLSAGDPRLHFGLGAAGKAERVEVAWPSGRTDRFENLSGDTGYLIREADPVPRPLAGFDPGGEPRPAAPENPPR